VDSVDAEPVEVVGTRPFLMVAYTRVSSDLFLSDFNTHCSTLASFGPPKAMESTFLPSFGVDHHKPRPAPSPIRTLTRRSHDRAEPWRIYGRFARRGVGHTRT
jgi:hypothetical protein